MSQRNFLLNKIGLIMSAGLAMGSYAQQLEQVEVVGSAVSGVDNGIKDSEIEGSFGGTQSIADIARSVTPISEWLLKQAAVNTLRDLQRVAPNTYSAAGFGAPSLPTIRGQRGEVFMGGLRRQVGNNGLGIPLSFNSVGQINVARGTPSVILGATQRTGGFVDLQPKRPDLDRSFGSLTLTAGQWDKYGTQLDYSELIEPSRQAIRVSIEHKNEGSYYHHSNLDSNNLFIAYRLLPNAHSEWDLSLEYYKVDWTDNAGLNRPTQDLIDHGRYVQGQGRQANGSTVPGAGAVIEPVGLTKISRRNILADPLDVNDASTLLLHSRYQYSFNERLSLINRTYFEHFEREEIAQNSFVEVIDGADTFENRSEIYFDDTVFGLNVRYNDVLGFSQFSTEADLPIDLTGPISNRRIPLTSEQKSRLVELRPGVFVSPGGQYDVNGDGDGDFLLSDTTDSTSWQTGLFVQHKQNLHEQVWITAGIRGDWYDVKARDPIAPQGITGARDSHSALLKSASFSVNYRPLEAVTVYMTTAYSESTSNSMAGGVTLSADNEINPLNFSTDNTLYESGIKYAPDDSSWYGDLAAFQQTRSLRNRDGSNTGISTQGVELQLFYQGERGWANMGASYLDAQYDNSTSTQDVAQVIDSFSNARPDIIVGTGRGAPNAVTFARSDTRLQGIPRWAASFAAGFRLNDVWSVGGSGVFTGSYPLDYLQTVTIPEQFTLNANLEYRFNQQRSSLRLEVFNLTNEENFTPVHEGGYFGATLIFPELPRYVDLKLAHKF
ncbi:MAG: TonB-dependent receptor [Gammaproteobacteria bacterium]|nr:TonB-dependent receptor [Gammaproteobacteria bacterium]